MRAIQFITHETDTISYVEGARLALEGGCRWVQLRMKDASDDEVRKAAAEILPMCKSHDAVFLLDDRVHLVKEVGADGVHLGKNDMPVDEARRVLGEEYIIGGTANTFDDIERLWQQGADYIGCGPYRYTTTKKNLAPVLGIDGYRSIMQRMEEAGINLPVVAIGGITAEDIDGILATGVKGIAVSGTILRAEDPKEEMCKLINNQQNEQ